MGRFGGFARPVMRLAWYRFRTTLSHRPGGYLAIVVLVGLVGGLALGSIAAARRTASSPAVYFASSDLSDLFGASGVLNPTLDLNSGYDPTLVREISRLPYVKQVQTQAGIDFLPLNRRGTPLYAPNFYPAAAGNGYGSVDGLYFDQDRVTVTQGRMADPNRPDEMMLTAQAAKALYVHVGSVLPVGIYTNAQTQLPAFGTAAVAPTRVVDEKVVGLFVFPATIVADDVDVGSGPNNLFTPALTRQLLGCCVNYAESGVQVEGRSRNVPRVENEIARVLPAGFPAFTTLQSQTSKAQRAITPEAIALGVFGGIVALAALLITAQLIGRELRLGAGEREVMRALGAGPRATSTDGIVGVLFAVVAGALVAAAVAVGLSPLAPLGPFRPVYPHPGVSFDWTVLGFGVLALVVVLGAIALVIGYLHAPHRELRRVRSSAGRPSRVCTAAAKAGMGVPATTGVRFALEPGAEAGAAPARSAILGALIAVVVLVATVTFGASLDSLVSHPALYGWNWDYMLGSTSDIPQQQATTMLERDRYVSQWSGIYTTTLQIDGQAVPVIAEGPGTAVQPPVLSGHGLEGAGQVVLGAVTLAQLHEHVGGTVVVTTGITAPARVRVVGTASMPAIGSTGVQHTEMGTGAVLAEKLVPKVDRNPFNVPLTGPNDILVRLRPGADRTAAKRSLEQIAKATSNTANFGVTLTGVLRPAEIVNYRTLGATPLILGAGLAAGAVAALVLTLVASVRRRRRDLALLKALGFTGRQLAATVGWQSTVAVALGTIAGVPLGIALGRWLWDLFARDIHAVPSPSVPAIGVTLIALGALVLANLVAFFPGRLAARTKTTVLLHSE
jgi:predicted secreted protein